MTDARTLALRAARSMISKLPLPIATPVELRRAAAAPSSKALSFKRIAVAGRGAGDCQVLSDYLQEQGARVEVAASTEPADAIVCMLGDRAGLDDVLGLHGALTPRLPGLARGGRVLVVVRSATPVVTGAVHGFVRSLARELGRRGATVNAILGEDLAAVCPVAAFLLSDRASYLSGQSVALAAGPMPPWTASSPSLAVVTGAAQGIGAAISKVLAASGHRVALLDMQRAAGEAMCDALGGEPAGMAFFECDVRDSEVVEAALERARALSPLGTIDVLVNNAGITRDRTFAKMSEQQWSEVLNVNLAAAMHVMRRALPRMSAGGRVINVASVSGLAGNFGQTNYAAAKGGLIGLTAQAGRELEARGLCVTGVAPGLIDTDMTAAIPVLQKEIAHQMISLAQSGVPEDVGMLVEFLARRDAWPLRGQTLRVDGGMFFGP